MSNSSNAAPATGSSSAGTSCRERGPGRNRDDRHAADSTSAARRCRVTTAVLAARSISTGSISLGIFTGPIYAGPALATIIAPAAASASAAMSARTPFSIVAGIRRRAIFAVGWLGRQIIGQITGR